jgi:hypothetical protein
MDFKNLFEQVKGFTKEQEKQKQRGLNNYNILTTVLKEHDEVRLHSRMIASLLDPFGEHYQSTLFLDKFLEILNISIFKIDSKNCSIYLEYQNIDLYITDGDKHIIIENKVYAKDQERQIERYIKIIKDENQDLNSHDILVIYLSLDRDKPTQYSLGNLSVKNGTLTVDTKEIALFKSIHYKNEILDWLAKCKYEVQNITNLNEVFRQYIDVVKMINNQYEDKIMSLSDYIIENKEVYKLAIELKQELPKAREKSINIFLKKIVSSLEKKLGSEWEVKLEEKELSKRYSVPLKIYKKDWIKNKENNIIFGIGFNEKNYYDGYFGIVDKYGTLDIYNIIKVFNKRLNKLNYELETTEWWLHWEWSHSELSDFIEYIQFNENAEKEFINGLMNLIKIFELDTNLMTEINSYLNEKDNY